MASVNDLSVKQVAEIKARILAGEFQHKLASEFELNQGRINEIAKGKRFAFVPPAKIKNGKMATAPRP